MVEQSSPSQARDLLLAIVAKCDACLNEEAGAPQSPAPIAVPPLLSAKEVVPKC